MSIQTMTAHASNAESSDPCEVRGRQRVTLTPQLWLAAVLYLAAVALLLRMTQLDVKPLHHDEGVNAYFLTRLVNPPHEYRYDPTNYHGPLLYYLAWASTAVFGLTDFAIRFVPAVFGLLTIALVLPLRRTLGDLGTLSAATLLALSPGAVFHSRYFIHESILVCSTLALVVAFQGYLTGRRPAWLLLASLAAAAMTTTKETWIIAAGVLGCAAVSTVLWYRWRGHHARAAAPCRWPHATLVASVVALFAGVNLLFYTSLFTNWAGALDPFRAFDTWAATGQAEHTHPWFIYLRWLGEDELPVLVLGLCGAALALARTDNRFAVFTAFWAGGMIAAYSAIPYKTPWLTLNLLPPLALGAGYLIDRLERVAAAKWRGAGLAAGAVVAAIMIYQTVAINFLSYDDERRAYVYAGTSREIVALVTAIGDLIDRQEPVPVVVMSREQFPLSWYLRDVAAAYPGHVHALERGVVVASTEQTNEVTQALGNRFARLGEFQLRPGVVLVLYASPDLVDRASARRIFKTW